MIFGGPAAYDFKRPRKLERHEVYAADPSTLTFLDWSRSATTFDQSDHLERVLQPGRYPLVVDPIVSTKRLTKVLMDGGSDLNILYDETLDAIGIDRSRLRPSEAPFQGIVPGKWAMLLGQIDLPVTFGTPSNFRKETLTFKVVGFHGTYHAILGWPCYAKFMAIPNYTYLKLKLSGPNGVITVGMSFQKAYECDVECCEYTAAITCSEDHAVRLAEGVEDPPDSKQSTTSFEAIEGMKEVPLDPNCTDGRTVRIGAAPSPK